MHPITQLTAESAELTGPARWHALVQAAAQAGQIDALAGHLATLPLTPLVAARRAQLLARSRAFGAAMELLAPFTQPLPTAQLALLSVSRQSEEDCLRVIAMSVNWISETMADVEASYRLHHARALALVIMGRRAEARHAFSAAETLSETLGLHHVRLAVRLELIDLDVQDGQYTDAAERYGVLADHAGKLRLDMLHRRSLEGLFWTTLVLGGDLSAVASRYPLTAGGQLWRALATLIGGSDVELPRTSADVELYVVAKMWRHACAARLCIIHADVRGAQRAMQRAPMDAQLTVPLHRAMYLAGRALLQLYAGDPLSAQIDMHTIPDSEFPIERALKATVAMQILVVGVRVPESSQYPLDRAARALADVLCALPVEARYLAVSRLGRLAAGAMGLFARSSYGQDIPEVAAWLEHETVQVDAAGVASLRGERLKDWPRAFVRLLDDVMLGRHLQDSEDRTVRRYRTAMRDIRFPVVFETGVLRALERSTPHMREFDRLSWPDL